MKDEKDHGASLAAVESAGSIASDVAPHVAKHTPGPWTLQPCTHGGLLLRRGDQLGPNSHIQSSLQILPEADAHLIAAAPELLSALKNAYYELNEIRARDGVPYTHQGIQASVDENYFSSVVDDCRAAIAKAEGRQ